MTRCAKICTSIMILVAGWIVGGCQSKSQLTPAGRKIKEEIHEYVCTYRIAGFRRRCAEGMVLNAIRGRVRWRCWQGKKRKNGGEKVAPGLIRIEINSRSAGLLGRIGWFILTST